MKSQFWGRNTFLHWNEVCSVTHSYYCFRYSIVYTAIDLAKYFHPPPQKISKGCCSSVNTSHTLHVEGARVDAAGFWSWKTCAFLVVVVTGSCWINLKTQDKSLQDEIFITDMGIWEQTSNPCGSGYLHTYVMRKKHLPQTLSHDADLLGQWSGNLYVNQEAFGTEYRTQSTCCPKRNIPNSCMGYHRHSFTEKHACSHTPQRDLSGLNSMQKAMDSVKSHLAITRQPSYTDVLNAATKQGYNC